MKARTWSYGTRQQATVDAVLPGSVVMLTDERGEGHIIVGVEHAITPVAGLRVTIEFCAGGPTGGYWKIVGGVS